MLRNLLYVASESQLAEARQSFNRLSKNSEKNVITNTSEIYYIEHYTLTSLKLFVHVLRDDSSIVRYLAREDIDLIIYDERLGARDAVTAIESLSDEIIDYSQTWGPDFNFPLRRCIAILNDTNDAAEKSFVLGRDKIKDVIIDPHSFVKILRRIAKILAVEVQQNLDLKVGMALSGGALEGYLYQIGAAFALDNAFIDTKTTSFDVYSGISSGSIVSSLLATGMDLKEVIKSTHGKSEVLPQLKSKTLFDFAAKDVVNRIVRSTTKWTGLDTSKMVTNVLRAIPTGLFKGEALKEYFEACLEISGKSNYFHMLKPNLLIGATDQDSLEHVIFQRGSKPEATISEAMRASCALPPFFTPMKIGNRRYVDCQITRTSNLEKVIDSGCRLVFIIDPLKPFASQVPGSVDKEGGVFSLIQTVKALVYSRFNTTLSHMTERFPDVDFIVFQPDEETMRKMAGSPMRYKIRTEIVDLAYHSTLKKLIARHSVYKTKLAKHGITLASLDHLQSLERTGIEV
jgi:predicted acylesterase/phospholipase RssA